MRKALSLGVLVLSMAGYAAAIQDVGPVFQTNGLLKNSFISGNISYSVYAPADVNVFLLVKDVNLGGGETALSINEKINAARLKLYPDKEIILSGTTAKAPGVVGSTTVKWVYFFNRITGIGQSLSVQYYGADVAVIAQYIHYGSCMWYWKDNTHPTWTTWALMVNDHLHSGSLVGAYGLRGFKVTAILKMKADYQFWFFN